jgi:hypothetical protein
MIEATTPPRNADHVRRLLDFAPDVLAVCDDLGIEPILDSSLAVFAYTREPSLEVHDIDLACPEADFPRLQESLEARGIECRSKPWHVLQAHRNGLKIDFGASEHWNQDLPEDTECVRVGDLTFRAVSLGALRELYRRGLADTEGKSDAASVAKHASYTEKLQLLMAVDPRS